MPLSQQRKESIKITIMKSNIICLNAALAATERIMSFEFDLTKTYSVSMPLSQQRKESDNGFIRFRHRLSQCRSRSNGKNQQS